MKGALRALCGNVSVEALNTGGARLMRLDLTHFHE